MPCVRIAAGSAQRPVHRRWVPGWPVDLATTLGPLGRGQGDPTTRVGAGALWRATRTPEGPATVRYRRSEDAVEVTAWGPGAAHEVEVTPRVLGEGDDPTGFAAGSHPVMARAWRRYGPGWRVPRTGRVLEALVPAILEQRVSGRQARSAWRTLVRRFGEPAPLPAAEPDPPSLTVPPDGPAWATVPSWAWHSAGVDPARASAVVAAARRWSSLERLATRSAAEARAALESLPGVGAWTAAEVAVRALGDVDAVSFGDFHLGRLVTYALTGRLDGDDATMGVLLEPWSGQRARAVRMIELAAAPPPRRGPRATITDHRSR